MDQCSNNTRRVGWNGTLLLETDVSININLDRRQSQAHCQVNWIVVCCNFKLCGVVIDERPCLSL